MAEQPTHEDVALARRAVSAYQSGARASVAERQALDRVVAWAGHHASSPESSRPINWRPQVGNRVRVTNDGHSLRLAMAHHHNRTGTVHSVRGGGMNPGRRIDVDLDQIGTVTFLEAELEPEGE